METRVHVSLPVTDVDRSVAFYESLFATPATKRQPGYANFRLTEPRLHLSLVEGPVRPPDGHQHFGIEVFDASALSSWRDRVEGRGLPSQREESVTCCYAVADKVWTQDPDGYRWEIWQRHADVETMSAPKPLTESTPAATEATCCAPSCCS